MIRAVCAIAIFFMTFALAEAKKEHLLPLVSMGSKTAPVKVYMYYSLSCGHCREFEEKEFPKIKAELIETGKVYWVFKDYPLDGPAVSATLIAHCKSTKDDYLKIANHLMKHQEDWHVEDGWHEKLIHVSKKAGLTDEEINKTLKNEDLLHAIFEDCLNARKKYGVNFAPAFVINGKLFDPEGKSEMTFKNLQKIVREEMNTHPKK